MILYWQKVLYEMELGLIMNFRKKKPRVTDILFHQFMKHSTEVIKKLFYYFWRMEQNQTRTWNPETGKDMVIANQPLKWH